MRVLLADGEPDVRWALRLVLTHDLGMRVVGEAGDTAELWARLRDTTPDLLLLEWEMFGSDVAGAMDRLRSLYPFLRVVALSRHPETRRSALAAGADAFVSKADAPDQLLAALKAISLPDQPGDSGVREDAHG